MEKPLVCNEVCKDICLRAGGRRFINLFSLMHIVEGGKECVEACGCKWEPPKVLKKPLVCNEVCKDICLRAGGTDPLSLIMHVS